MDPATVQSKFFFYCFFDRVNMHKIKTHRVLFDSLLGASQTSGFLYKYKLGWFFSASDFTGRTWVSHPPSLYSGGYVQGRAFGPGLKRDMALQHCMCVHAHPGMNHFACDFLCICLCESLCLCVSMCMYMCGMNIVYVMCVFCVSVFASMYVCMHVCVVYLSVYFSVHAF